MNRSANPWLLVAYTAAMQAFSIGIASYTFALFVLPWMAEFGATRSELMLAPSGYAIGMALLSPFGGLLLDRIDNRRLVLFGGLLYAASLGVLALASATWMIIAVFLVALPLAITFTGPLMAFSLVARRFTEGRGLALGVAALGTSAGGLLLPPLVSWLLEGYDWRTVINLLALAVLVLVVLPAGFVLRGVGSGAGAGAPVPLRSSLALMRSRPVLLLGLSQLLPVTLFAAVLFSLGIYADEIGIDQQAAAWTIAVGSGAMALGKVLAGLLSERFAPRLLYCAMMALIALAMALIAAAGSFIALAAGMGLLALMIGGVVPLIAATIARCWPLDKFGSVMGVVQALGALSSTGSYLAARLSDASGSYSAAFLAMTLLLIPAVLSFFWMTAETRPAAAPA